jgi:hypothetical protein
LIIAGWALPAAAQDDAAILQRLDAIERRLSDLEQHVGGGAAAAPAPAGVVAGTPAKNRKPGWRINVYPYTENGPGAAPIVRQNVGIGPISFAMHLDAAGPNRTPVQYQGTAYFEVKEPGNYTFNISLDFNSNFRCEGSLSVESNQVVNFADIKAAGAHPGDITLQQGTFQLIHTVGCWWRDGKGELLGTNNTDNTVRDIVYSVKVLGPSDDAVRDFTPEELFIITK